MTSTQMSVARRAATRITLFKERKGIDDAYALAFDGGSVVSADTDALAFEVEFVTPLAFEFCNQNSLVERLRRGAHECGGLICTRHVLHL